MNIFKRTFMWLLMFISSAAMVLASGFEESLQTFRQSAGLDSAQTSVLVMELNTGNRLVDYNSSLPLIPASITKCVTVATLLEKVGSRFRFETPVWYTGKIENGVLNGDLVVEASGDPSLNTRHEPGSKDFVAEIVDAVKSLRISDINGEIIIDESNFPGPAVNPTWQKGDLPHAYGTGTHGFNFEDNACGSRSVADPAGVFRTRLCNALSQSGISIDAKEQDTGGRRHRLGEHRSESVDEIMRSCMMRSDNQFAEALLRSVGFQYGKEGSTSRGAAEELKYWKRRHADMEGVEIVDGSGLSRSNRITANFMSDVLSHMSGNPYYASFFPLAGQEGTLKKFLAGTPLDGEIAMKTGSMRGIQCYAGYKLDAEYAPTHIVVVMMNNLSNRAAARTALQRLLLDVFAPAASRR